jgi:putative FmdB family regulatory protein
MPIYAYRCTDCGFEKEVMRKVSDPLLTTCPECKTENFAKQLTAPGLPPQGQRLVCHRLQGRWLQVRRQQERQPAALPGRHG